MAYASDADLTTRIPATLTASAAQRALALSDAMAMIDDALFSDRAIRAHTFLAAHYLVLGGAVPGAVADGGIVASRSAGAISVSYAIPTIPAGWDPSLASTAYGRQYLAIASTVTPGPVVG